MRVSVKCMALDEFLDDSVKIDVIKIDVEGAELHALDGMQRTLARASGMLTMFVECNPPALKAAGGSALTLVDRLRDFGLTVMIIDEQNRRLCPIDPTIESVKCVNLYCTRQKDAIH